MSETRAEFALFELENRPKLLTMRAFFLLITFREAHFKI